MPSNYPPGVSINNPHFADNPPCICNHEVEDHDSLILNQQMTMPCRFCPCQDYHEYDPAEAAEDARLARWEDSRD